jgi:predicted enzyme related to lactoylglutathione lyase
MTGPVPYWTVDDIRTRLAAMVEAGAELVQDVQDVGGGKLIAFVKDADGNFVGLTQNPAA